MSFSKTLLFFQVHNYLKKQGCGVLEVIEFKPPSVESAFCPVLYLDSECVHQITTIDLSLKALSTAHNYYFKFNQTPNSSVFRDYSYKELSKRVRLGDSVQYTPVVKADSILNFKSKIEVFSSPEFKALYEGCVILLQSLKKPIKDSFESAFYNCLSLKMVEVFNTWKHLYVIKRLSFSEFNAIEKFVVNALILLVNIGATIPVKPLIKLFNAFCTGEMQVDYSNNSFVFKHGTRKIAEYIEETQVYKTLRTRLKHYENYMMFLEEKIVTPFL